MEEQGSAKPYYFCTISKKMELRDCFINIYDSPERTDAYFESIKRKYKILNDRAN